MDRVYLDRPTLCEVLSKKIRDYKKKNARLNSSQIAKSFGIATSTFNRIENLDINKPSVDQMVKILEGTGDSIDVTECLREYFPELHENVSKHYSNVYKKREAEECYQKYFEDESTYKLLLKATTKAGLREQEVVEELGNRGHKIFMKLASEGVFKNINGKFYADTDRITVKNQCAVRISEFLYKDLYEYIKLGRDDDQYLSNISYSSLDFNKVKGELKALYDDFNSKVKIIMKDPKNIGEDVIISSNLLRRLK